MQRPNLASPSRFLIHLRTRLSKRLRLGHTLRELDPDLASRPLVFHAPPLRDELLSTIQLISPQFYLRANERSRVFWEANQNGACWGEYDALKPYLDRLGRPARALDIGPGLGRSTIFFKKVSDWAEVPFDLYEGSGTSTKYTKAGPRFDDSFCGNIPVLEQVLAFNQIQQATVFDASELGASLAGLPGPYGFIYSFYAVGWHWSLEHFLEELLELMTEDAVGAFTIHDRVRDLSFLGDIPHRVMEFKKSWPRERWSRMLVLSKSERMITES